MRHFAIYLIFTTSIFGLPTCFGVEMARCDDGTQDGKGGPFQLIFFWGDHKDMKLNPWLGTPTLSVRPVEGKSTPLWLSDKRGHLNESWAFEKINDAFLIRYKNPPREWKNWSLSYSLDGDSHNVFLSEKVTDACLWMMPEVVEIKRLTEFATALQAKNGKWRGYYLGTEVSRAPIVIREDSRDFHGWRLHLTKERQGRLGFSNVELMEN